MKHYKNTAGKVFAFESDGSQDHLIMGSMVSLSDAELTEELAPAPIPLPDLKSNAIETINSTYRISLGEIDIIGVDYLRRQMADQADGKPTPGKDRIPMTDVEINAFINANDNLIADAMRVKIDSIAAIGSAADEASVGSVVDEFRSGIDTARGRAPVR